MTTTENKLEQRLSEKYCKADCMQLLSELEALHKPYGIGVSKPSDGWSEKSVLVLSQGAKALELQIKEPDRVEKGGPNWGLLINEKESGGPGILYKRTGDGWHRFNHSKVGVFWKKVDNFFDSTESEILKFFGATRRMDGR